MVASDGMPFFRSFDVRARRALNGAADRVDEVVAAQRAAGVLLELVFLQAGQDDLGEMAVLIGLRLRDRAGRPSGGRP